MPYKRQICPNMKPNSSAVRRIQCPPSAPPKVVVESFSCQDAEDPLALPTTSRPVLQQLAEPEYNTCVRQKSEIDTIKNVQASVNLSPKTMAAIAPKITQKLNFQPGDTVFKNLESLNVNDSVVIPKKMGARPVNPKVKQPEIKLADYLENIRLIEMYVPEPALNLKFDRIPFDYYGTYCKIYN